jgi:dienelactone hydrolase
VLAAYPAGLRAQQPAFRTHTTTYQAPQYSSADAWKKRAAYLREHVLASAGLLPMPERTPLHSEVFGELKHDGYSVSKVYFESLPGFFVTGNLYRPAGDGPFPAVLSPHGHWPYGRLENTPLVSAPGRAINLARQGFVVFTYDMIGYNDSRQLTHTFGGPRESLWGLSLGGLQLWNSIRSLDFLESLPYVRRDALAATGESGGGTQTFLLAAVDDRVAVAAPVNMISLEMQGGCLCENPPGLRLDTTNVEIAATIAPRPLLMVSATGDWTAHTMEREFPAVRSLYALAGAADRVHAVRVQAEHNYNRESREAMYAWMARWLQNAPPDAVRAERAFTPDPLNDLLVFHQRPLPSGALSAADVTRQWVEDATRQIASTAADVLGRSLAHALGYGEPAASLPVPQPTGASSKTVLLGSPNAALEQQLRQSGFTVLPIPFTPFDTEAAAQIRHFETYNRTAASQRVADIVSAMRAHPGAALVASGDAALAGLLAAGVTPVRTAILDVGNFDTSSDADYLEHLYIPGIRRAGGLQTAASRAGAGVVIHNAGERFVLTGVRVQRAPLGPREIVAALRTGGS